jgi:N-acetylneuraminic acid mutarotase
VGLGLSLGLGPWACGSTNDPSGFDTGDATAGDPASGDPDGSEAPGDDGQDDTTAGAGTIPPDGVWQVRAPLGEGPRQETGVAALDGEVYVIGGFALGGGLVPRVEAYDPEGDTWRTLGDFPSMSVHHANTASAGGRLWVLGYLSGLTFDAVGDAWSYDPATDTWSTVAAMPAGTERGGSGVAVIDDVVYVIGGLRQTAAVADAWAYDTAADTWAPMPDLPTARDHLVAAGVGGRVWCIGGRETNVGAHVPTVDVYDPASNTWSAGPPMPTSRGGMAAAVVDDWIFVAGGEGNPDDPSGVFAELEVLDTAAGAWTSLTPMPTPRHGTGGAALDGVVYVPGGAEEQALAVVATHEAWVVGG